jgi:hypothetical protein
MAPVLSLLAMLIFVPAASASFPGTNGRLAYTVPVPTGAATSYRLETAYAAVRGVHAPAGVSLAETAVDRGGDSFDPAWAADGRTLAFASTRSGSAQIYLFQLSLTGGVVPLCGLEVCQLTHDAANDYAPAFSPDQQRIAYTAISGGRPQIFTIASTGAEIRGLTAEGANQEPDWSQAGIVFASDRSGHFQIYVMSSEGGEVRRLTEQGGEDVQPTWSPDDREVAYTHREAGSSQVFAVNAAGGAPRQLTRSSPGNSFPAWSADGAAILLTHGRPPPAEPDGALVAAVPSVRQRSPVRERPFDMEAIDAHSGAPLHLGVPSVGFNGDWAPLPVPPSSAATPPLGTAIAQPVNGHVTVSPGHSETPALATAGTSGSTLHNEVEVPVNSTYNATRGEVRLVLTTTAAPGGSPPRPGSPSPGSPPSGPAPVPPPSGPAPVPPPPGSPPGGSPTTTPNPVATSSVTKAAVTGGRFAVLQQAAAAVPVIRLLGRPPRCTRARGAIARAIHRTRVKIHSQGSVRGEGRNGHGFTRGTLWEIEETCRGTIYRSIHDTVLVTDPARHRIIAVTSGHHYLVRARHR